MSTNDNVKINFYKRPKVSVCMVSYNHEKFVKEAIESVLSQSYNNFEFLILEHASTDNSLNIIKKFSDERINLTVYDKNYHSTYAANKLLEKVTGEYIAFLCSDDSWEESKLEKQIDFFENNKNYAAVFSKINVIDEKSSKYKCSTPYDYYFNRFKNRTRFEWIKLLFDFQFNPFCCSSAMIRTNIWHNYGPYDIRSRNMQDFLLWTKILMDNEVYILEEKLTNMRYFKKQSNISGNTINHMTIVCNEALLSHENMFSNIDTIEKFKLIFPDSIQKYGQLYENDIKFYLANIGICAYRYDLKAYSLNTLYNLMGNYDIRKRLEERYNFTHLDLYKISENIDTYHYKYIMPFKKLILKKCKHRIIKIYYNFIYKVIMSCVVMFYDNIKRSMSHKDIDSAEILKNLKRENRLLKCELIEKNVFEKMNQEMKEKKYITNYISNNK